MNNIIYRIRLILYLIFLIFEFLLAPTLVELGLIGILFILIQFIFILRNIYEFIKDKNNDLTYNILHIDIYLYLIIFYFKLSNISLPTNTIMNYLLLNLATITVFTIMIIIWGIKINKIKLRV